MMICATVVLTLPARTPPPKEGPSSFDLNPQDWLSNIWLLALLTYLYITLFSFVPPIYLFRESTARPAQETSLAKALSGNRLLTGTGTGLGHSAKVQSKQQIMDPLTNS